MAPAAVQRSPKAPGYETTLSWGHLLRYNVLSRLQATIQSFPREPWLLYIALLSLSKAKQWISLPLFLLLHTLLSHYKLHAYFYLQIFHYYSQFSCTPSCSYLLTYCKSLPFLALPPPDLPWLLHHLFLELCNLCFTFTAWGNSFATTSVLKTVTRRELQSRMQARLR